MKRLGAETAKAALSAIQGQKILVLGDLILDEYLFGEVERISREAPVPIVRVTWERSVLGGAANVASNLMALGAAPLLVGVVGGDAAGARLQKLVSALGVDGAGLVVSPQHPTTIKTRVIGQHQQMLRIDREEHGPLCAQTTESLLDRLSKTMPNASAVIVSDYGTGVVGKEVMDALRERAAAGGIPWVVDPKPAHKKLYFGATAMTPNTKEFAELTPLTAKSDAELAEAAAALVAELGLMGLLVTRGEKGMALLSPGNGDRPPEMIPTDAVEVFDVSGAGDTVIAVFTAALAAGRGWPDAALLANAAAGVVVGKMGTATATPQEILDRLRARG